MNRFSIFAAVLAATLLAAPAMAADADKCLVDIPDNASAAFHQSRIAACTDRLRTQTDPDLRSQILATRAQSYVLTKSYVRALGDVQQWLALDPQSPEGRYDLALTHGSLGYYALALSEEEDAARFSEPTNNDIALRALWKALLGRNEEAIADANIAIAGTPSVPAYGARGYSELQMGRMAEAVQDFGEVIKLNPEDRDTYHYRGLALYGLDRYAEALADFEKSQKLIGNDNGDDEYIREVAAIMSAPQADENVPPSVNAPARPMGRTHNCSAYYPVMALQLNERATVILHYDVSVDSVVTNAGIERSSGNAMLDKAAVVCVAAHWRSKAAVQNGNPVATHQLAQIIFTMASAVSPARRAQTLAKLGRYDEAIDAYTESISAEPKAANAYFQRGFLHYLKHDYAEASADFDKALVLKPDFEDAKAARELVQGAVLTPGVPGKDI